MGAKLATKTIISSVSSGFKGKIEEHAFSDDNVDSITKTLLQMRGAALKLGQFISFQDDSMFSTKLMKALEKARNEANVMPPHQLEEIMTQNFGNYLDHLEFFENVPFAAASIG